jgi:hypothetical protein
MALVNAAGTVIEFFIRRNIRGSGWRSDRNDVGRHRRQRSGNGSVACRCSATAPVRIEASTFGACNDADVVVTGRCDHHRRAAHAGVAPERGISATMVLALALAEVYEGGWFGKVMKDGREGTSNVGSVGTLDGKSAGDATISATSGAIVGTATLHVNAAAPPPSGTVHISEIHYDNTGTDAGDWYFKDIVQKFPHSPCINYEYNNVNKIS